MCSSDLANGSSGSARSRHFPAKMALKSNCEIRTIRAAFRRTTAVSERHRLEFTGSAQPVRKSKTQTIWPRGSAKNPILKSFLQRNGTKVAARSPSFAPFGDLKRNFSVLFAPFCGYPVCFDRDISGCAIRSPEPIEGAKDGENSLRQIF